MILIEMMDLGEGLRENGINLFWSYTGMAGSWEIQGIFCCLFTLEMMRGSSTYRPRVRQRVNPTKG